MKRSLITSSYDYRPLMFPTGDDQEMRGRALQSAMEAGIDNDDDYIGCGGEKKRRLAVEQVRALEKSFEVDNKLDPERKGKLALDLGLQPRQVAVWFQNRRARWKGKQLEHEYAALKASYDALSTEFDCLRRDKDSLITEIDKLTAMLAGEQNSRFVSVKSENVFIQSNTVASVCEEIPYLLYSETGSAESDSSAVLNDDNGDPLFGSSAAASDVFLFAATVNTGFGAESASCSILNCKMEDYEFIGGDDEPCSSFFSDEQAPSLNCIDNWWS